MKIVAALLFVLIPFTGCFSGDSQVIDSSGTQMKKTDDPYFWDFGKVKKNAVVKHDFLIKNNLDKALKIRDVSTSCGCTASDAKKRALEPGEATEITVSFDSKGYKGQTQQFVYVATDDPANPVYKYTFKADVE